jgi:phosphatidylglycerol:prolipoprotein diacylglycerol transferase
MIPYIRVPDFPVVLPRIGTLPIHPFGVLVATGVLIGTALATRRAHKLGFDLDKLNSFITWMLVVGFIGGHVLDEIFYHPDELVRSPLTLVKLWAGLSSFGGFTGALIGILMWKYLRVEPIRTWGPAKLFGHTIPSLSFTLYWLVRRKAAVSIFAFADLILSVFPVAWIFGRSGCSSVHDHPGAVATAKDLLAVAYPSPNPSVTDGAGSVHHFGPISFIEGHYPRYDLGLLELMFTVVLAGAFALTWRKKLPTGSYVVAASLAYAPVRFAMDFLRIRTSESAEADPRYGGLTPAQWCCVALFVFGLLTLVYVRSLRRRGIDPARSMMADAASDPSLAAASAPSA